MVPSGFSSTFAPCATTMSANSGGSAFGTEMPTARGCAATGVNDGEDACTPATTASEAIAATAAPPATRGLVIRIRYAPFLWIALDRRTRPRAIGGRFGDDLVKNGACLQEPRPAAAGG